MVTKRLVNGIEHTTFDGCMFDTPTMLSQDTWNDALMLGLEVRARLIAEGLPEEDAPKIHCAVWQRWIGRGSGTELGDEISLMDMIGMIAAARGPNGEKFNGIDLIETKDVAADMPAGEFDALVTYLKRHDLKVGDIVACTWPDKSAGQGGAFGTDEDRDRMVAAVDRACRLWHRFNQSDVADYGRIRVDSGDGQAAFEEAPEENWTRLVGTMRALGEKAIEYSLIVVIEGEVCWGGQAGYRQCNALIEAVDLHNVMFQADAAHMLHFLAATNVDSEDSLLEPGVTAQSATREQLAPAWAKIASLLGPKTASFHFAQSDGSLFGSGTHSKTGKHCPPKHPNGKVDTALVAALFLLEDAA